MIEKNSIVDIGLKSVRTLGITNMVSKSSVQYYAYKLGFFETVSFLEEASSNEYWNYLQNINFSMVPTLSYLDEDVDYEEGDTSFFMRQYVEEEFENEINSYREAYQKGTLLPLPITYAEWETLKKQGKEEYSDIFKYINTLPGHFCNYHLITRDAFIQFNDGFYTCTSGRDDIQPLTGKTWRSAQQASHKLHGFNKRKFEEINDSMRFASLCEMSSRR